VTCLAFDERALAARLAAAPPTLRVAFGAACAERALRAVEGGAYQDARIDLGAARLCLDALWVSLEAEELDELSVRRHLNACDALLPSPDVAPPAHLLFTDQALTALIQALRAALTGALEHAVAPARTLYDIVDELATHDLGLRTIPPDEELRIREHQLVQAELKRQDRDASDIERGFSSETRERIIRRLRERAQREGALLFHTEPRP
jgi:hypothetical protein